MVQPQTLNRTVDLPGAVLLGLAVFIDWPIMLAGVGVGVLGHLALKRA
ncbi:hypothetical protein [Robiginitomaculum antarcticum]|nr:hypothetical protein [Robiginitomaculum antarcticum]